jgi:hypothetical protein
MELTAYATEVINDLVRLQLMLACVVGDNNSFNKRIADSRREQREKSIAYFKEHAVNGKVPNITFEGPEPGQENAEYNTFLDETFGGFVLCRAVDFYHWYLKQVVLLILNANPNLLRQWAKDLRITNAEELDAFEKGQDREKLLTRWFRGAEWKTRKLVHEHFKIPLKEDLGLLVDVRNCIVHSLGKDTDGALEPVLKNNPRLSLSVANQYVVVGFNGSHAASEIVINDVSVIDQMLAQKFSLSTAPRVQPKISRVYS